QCVLLLLRAVVVASRRCPSDHAIEPADKIGGVRWRARQLLINCYVDCARAGIRIDVLDLRGSLIFPAAHDQPTPGRNLHPSTDIGLWSGTIKMMSGDDAPVEDQLDVIDRHDGPQR